MSIIPCRQITRSSAPPPDRNAPVGGGEEDQALGQGELNAGGLPTIVSKWKN